MVTWSLGSSGPVPCLLFWHVDLACCDEVGVGEDRSPPVDRGASFHSGLLPRLSRASRSLEHQALVLCCPQLQGGEPARFIITSALFAFLSAASSAFRDLNPAGLTKSSAQGGALYSQLRGQSGAGLEGKP